MTVRLLIFTLFVFLTPLAVAGQELMYGAKRAKASIIFARDQIDSSLKMLEGNVIRVEDGDTVFLQTRQGGRYTIDIRGIDAPEITQELGLTARDNLAALVEAMDVSVMIARPLEDGRFVGRIFLDGQDIGLQMINLGLAWYDRGGNDELGPEISSIFRDAETGARGRRLGVWKNYDPQSPWDFRSGASAKPATAATTISDAEKPEPKKTSKADVPVATPPEQAVKVSSQRVYILGPRGGCFYLNAEGAKTYVKNKTLCAK